MIKGLKLLKNNEHGFTLIEVMVVIIMIGILAAIAIPIYTNYVYRARTSEAVTYMGAIRTFMIERRNATGDWPTTLEVNNEFNNFNDLYYFNVPVITRMNSDRVNIVMTPSNNFDAPSGFSGSLRLDIDIAVTANNGWSGEVRDRWAANLPKRPSAT